MSVHVLDARRAHLHGAFNGTLAPALVVDSGDRVCVSTLDVAWGLAPPTSATAPRAKVEPRDPVRDDGPALTGPIAVRGAEPGMTLAVRIDAIRAAAWGYTWVGGAGFTGPGAALNAALGVSDQPLRLVRWTLADGVATSDTGWAVPLRPFPGTIGVAPAAPGWHDGWTPGRHGGNLDCRALVAGSTLYLPVGAPGALLSVGDGHAAQGDGELAGTAIEAPFAALELTLALVDDPVGWPRIRTADSWVTLGVAPTLDEAAAIATAEMLDLICARQGVDRLEALALASVAVDLRVTQRVNPAVGVHAVLRDDAFS